MSGDNGKVEQLMLYDDFCKGCIRARSRLICLHHVVNRDRQFREFSQGLIPQFCRNREIGPEWKRLKEAEEERDLEDAVWYGKAKIIRH